MQPIKTVAIEVEPETAALFQAASASDQQKMQTILRILFKKKRSKSEAASEFRKTMDRLGKNMKERGMTQAIMNEILDDV